VRPYKRLASSVWAEIRALWETGDVTLAELAARFGVTTRTLQAHFLKHGTQKGSKAEELAAAVQAEIFTAMELDRDTRVRLGNEALATAYRNAVVLERLVMAQLERAQDSPGEAYKAATAIKTLSLAAAALERVNGIKRSALGLDTFDPTEDETPVLIIRDLTEEDIDRIRSADGDDDDEGPDDHEGPDEEVHEFIEEAPKKGLRDRSEVDEILGGRLVRTNCV
jgi:hypothetical protein